MCRTLGRCRWRALYPASLRRPRQGGTPPERLATAISPVLRDPGGPQNFTMDEKAAPVTLIGRAGDVLFHLPGRELGQYLAHEVLDQLAIADAIVAKGVAGQRKGLVVRVDWRQVTGVQRLDSRIRQYGR